MIGFFDGDHERNCWWLGAEIAGPECRARHWHDHRVRGLALSLGRENVAVRACLNSARRKLPPSVTRLGPWQFGCHKTPLIDKLSFSIWLRGWRARAKLDR
jgi:hypothetical protein